MSSPLAVCIASFDTLRTGLQEVGIRVKTSLDLLSCAGSTWCLQPLGLTFNLWEAARYNPTSLYDLGSLLDPLDQLLERCFSYLILGIL